MASGAPYYDTFNPAQKRKRILFKPRQAIQSREFNELQTTILYEMQRIANVLHTEGSLLKGGEVKLEAGTLNIKEAISYAQGYTHDLPAASFSIGVNETVNIGFILVQSIITSLDDPTLRDPATGTRAENQPGADRLRIDAVWVRESDARVTPGNFYPLISIVNGAVVSTVKEAPEFAGLDQKLAKYDNSANGSYVVDGFIPTFVVNDVAAQDHILNISEGSAHVDGYIVDYQAAKRIAIDWAIDTRFINNEPVAFNADGWYTLRWSPIASVGEISAQRVVTRTITHGTFTGAQDLLPDQPVVSIIEVKQGGTTYAAGTDYTQNGDYISWAPAGAEPSPSSSYTVKYIYQAVLTPIISDDRKQIYLAGVNPGSTVTVDYDFYIPRMDRLTLGRDGILTVLKGTPDILTPVAPPATSGLSLATVRVAYGVLPVITADTFRAFKNSDIQVIAGRIGAMEYNVAQLILRDQLAQSDPTALKKNVFTDPFTSNAQRDAGVTQTALSLNGVLEPNVVSQDYLLYTAANIQLPHTLKIEIEQTGYTKTRLVNEFEQVAAPPAQVTVTPSTYTWTSYLNVEQTVTEPVIDRPTNLWLYNQWGTWNLVNSSNMQSIATGGGFGTLAFQIPEARVRVGAGTVVGTVSSQTQQLVNVAQNIPGIAINLKATRYSAGEQVTVEFDSRVVGTTTASAQGLVDYTFNVPGNTPSGAKSIVLTGVTSGIVGRSVFTATPQTYLVTTTNTQYVAQTALTIQWIDPVAQTFTPSRDMNLAQLDLAFDNTTSQWVDVLICETDNGYPNTDKVLAATRLFAADVKATGWSTAVFANPPAVKANEEYCWVAMTPDNNLRIKVAELGKFDSSTGRFISKQPYGAGVLFNSSNARAWSPIQTEDAMFRLHAAQYQLAQGWTTINTRAVTGATDLMLLATTDIQPGTVVEFRAVLSARDNTEVTIYPNFPAAIEAYTGNVVVQYRMTTLDPYNTAQIRTNIGLAVGRVVFPMTYVTRRDTISGTQIKAYLRAYEPSGTALNVFYETASRTLNTSGQTNWAAAARGSTTDIGTYRYAGSALTATKPAIVTYTGTVMAERQLVSARELAAGEFFYGNAEALGARLYVQVPIITVDRSLFVQSPARNTEYYLNSAAYTASPSRVVVGNTELTPGTLGSLAVGQFAWGNQDSLAGNRLYVRLPTAEVVSGNQNPAAGTYPANFVRMSSSPDTLATGAVTATEWQQMTRSSSTQIGIDSVEAGFQSGTGLSITSTRYRIEGTTSNNVRRPLGGAFRAYSV